MFVGGEGVCVCGWGGGLCVWVERGSVFVGGEGVCVCGWGGGLCLWVGSVFVGGVCVCGWGGGLCLWVGSVFVGGEGVCVCGWGLCLWVGGSVFVGGVCVCGWRRCLCLWAGWGSVFPSGAGCVACIVPCDTDVALCCSIAGLVDVLFDVFVLSSVVRLKKLCCRA